MLQVDNLRVTFGATAVVDRVSIRINHNESVALIGPNGAGKTTVGKAIAGLQPHEGQIALRLGSVTAILSDLPAWALARRGIVYIPEVNAVYNALSVAENLKVVPAAISVSRSIASTILDELYSRFSFLRERSRQGAGTLSGGEKKLLAIARGLFLLRVLKASSQEPIFPLLILDEPSHGLSPQALDVVRDALTEPDVALLLIEQMSRFALELCSRAYVLRQGAIVMEGPSEAIREDALLEFYLAISRDGPKTLWIR